MKAIEKSKRLADLGFTFHHFVTDHQDVYSEWHLFQSFDTTSPSAVSFVYYDIT